MRVKKQKLSQTESKTVIRIKSETVSRIKSETKAIAELLIPIMALALYTWRDNVRDLEAVAEC